MRSLWFLLVSLAFAGPALAEVGYNDPFSGYDNNQYPCKDCTEGGNANCLAFAAEAKRLEDAASNDKGWSAGHCLPLSSFTKAFNGSIPNGRDGSFANADWSYQWCMSHTVGQGRAQLQAEANFINRCHASLMRRVQTPAGSVPKFSDTVRSSRGGGKGNADRSTPIDPIKNIPGNPVLGGNSDLLGGDGPLGRNGPGAIGTSGGTTNTGGARTGGSQGLR